MSKTWNQVNRASGANVRLRKEMIDRLRTQEAERDIKDAPGGTNMLQPQIVLSPLWPPQSAHRKYWERYNCALVYEYDPTDDGPEIEVIKNIMFGDYDERVAKLLKKGSRA